MAIRSRDVISDVTIQLSIDDFLYVLFRNEACVSLSFRNIVHKSYEVGTSSLTL